MDELVARREKLLLDAEDCELIGNLATDPAKRDLFRRLAVDLRQLAADLNSVIVARTSQKAA